ncbi:hypothetical protein Rhow_007803 [Rhodococcus wratislaviensis]|uniref:Uncharacterized protein n=1 Tax=Rhodococcus wratislaviensis TaxID=44752 RepID=A0A402CIY6_RHOWR|nr:hypothetical protein Rhow_007803 [Rhodococcus wratislaviensis]
MLAHPHAPTLPIAEDRLTHFRCARVVRPREVTADVTAALTDQPPHEPPPRLVNRSMARTKDCRHARHASNSGASDDPQTARTHHQV